MKKYMRGASPLLFLLCLLLTLSTALCAGELWSEEYYRALDFTDQLSQAEQESLDEDCLAFLEKWKLDMVLLAGTPEDDEESLEEVGADLYEDWGFGYGPGQDGFLFLFDPEKGTATYLTFGAATRAVPQDYLDFAAGKSVEMEREHGLFGVLYSGLKYLSNYLEDPPAEQRSGEVQRERTLPDWYPAETENFPFFHDEQAPRVVDEADIFPQEREEALEARIGEIREELQRDIVIYTDLSDYGLGRDVCAADFYDFNGYGYGPEREGVCLFICMEPGNRGWWCCCTGPVTMGLYTEDVANLLDDALYEYMSSGDYGAGAADWVEHIRTLYQKGSPFAPDWYPAPGESLTQHQDPQAPRVVDEAGMLSQEERSALETQAREISQARGVDVAIHTAPSPVGMDYAQVGELYYTYMGYGQGASCDGILLTVFQRPGYYPTCRLAAFGSSQEKLSDVNKERLLTACQEQCEEEAYYQAFTRYLQQVDHMQRTGRVPRGALYWALIAILGMLVGSTLGGILLGRARAGMETPKLRENADAYLNSRASHIADAGSVYLYTSTSERYSPPPKVTSRGSGGSSGHSSFSSSYSGSSGASHSGSGRSF